MRSRVVVAMANIKKNGFIKDLAECSTLKERHEKLLKFLPEISIWDVHIAKPQLFFHIQHVFGVDLGVCQYFIIDDYRQYCRFNGEKTECTCVIPQPLCIFRDKDGSPKYPEFLTSLPILTR